MSAAAGERRPFPWREVMAFGLGLLRLSPAAFWALTPREFEVLLGATREGGWTAPGRGELDEMMRHFPDQPQE